MNTTLERLSAALTNRYRVDRELGAGGMATVYLAHDLKHEREVAIKVLHPDLGAALGAERFLAEIKTTAKLQHPHILPLLDSGEADGLLYYVMPYVRGETLRARLSHGPMPQGEALETLRNVLQALQYAHANGLVHRDVKPENILLTSGTAVVADFGIAKALSTSRTQAGVTALTQAGSSVGTPAYMAPEQAAGDPNMDARADLYAWGVVAYEVLAGKHPFADQLTPQGMITAHMTKEPASLATVAGAVPAAVAGTVTACLAKHPDERPASADAALLAFDTRNTPTSTPRRARAMSGALRMAIALLVVIVAGAAMWFGLRPKAASAPRSLAVLPFDIGGDTSNAYVAEGLTAELTTKLSRVPGLVVRAYSSSRNVRALDPQEAARTLGVASLVTATMRRDKDRLRVNATLIAADDARVLWSESFDERDNDQFALQDRLAAAIARALEIQLSQADERAVRGVRTEDAVAHDLVQRSRYLADQLTAESIRRALEYAQEAIRRDSTYADAWSALANAYFIQADDIVEPATILEPMRHAAERVAQLDPNGADGHALAGVIAAWYTRDSVVAARELQRALVIDSTNSYALTALGSFVGVSYPDSMGTLFARAARSDPLSTVALYFSALMPPMHRALTPDTARIVCERLRAAVPPLGDNCNALRLDEIGRRADAQNLLREADTTGLEGGAWSWRAYAAVVVGDSALARTMLARAALESTRRYVRQDFVAWSWIALGEPDKALKWTQRALMSRNAGAWFASRRFRLRFPNDRVRLAQLDSVLDLPVRQGRAP